MQPWFHQGLKTSVHSHIKFKHTNSWKFKVQIVQLANLTSPQQTQHTK